MSPETWGVLADIITAIAAAVAAFAALVGLNTWKKQRIWERDAELARKANLALNNYCNSLLEVTMRELTKTDVLPLEIDDGSPPQNPNADQNVAAAILDSSQKSIAQKTKLEELFFETNALWGAEFKSTVVPLFEIHNELQRELQLLVTIFHSKTREEDKAQARARYKKTRQLAYPLTRINMDFQEELQVLMKRPIAYLSGKMRS